jgi:CBS domain-containing protein
MTELSRGDRRAESAVAPLIGTAIGASPAGDAEPPQAEVTDLAQHRRRAGSGARLSAASAASVRDAAIAVLSHGVRYLPVVEDGTLVGLVALAGAPDPGASSFRPRARTRRFPR